MNYFSAGSLIALAILVTTGASAVALRGSLTPTGQFQAIDIPGPQLTPIYSYLIADKITLPTTNFTVVANPQTQNATVLGSTLLGSFSSADTVAVNFQENISINATKNPFFEITVSTNPVFTSKSGFAFGLRFLASLTNGSIVQLGDDHLPIEHVPSGKTTTLEIYVPNYGPGIVHITAIRFYTEERASIHSDYSIEVISITASNLVQTALCSSRICFIPLDLPNGTGYFDALVADTVFTGRDGYNLALSYNNQVFVSRTYSNGTNHVSLTNNSQNTELGNNLEASFPKSSTSLYIISNSPPQSIQVQDLKSTFTLLPVSREVSLPWQTSGPLLLIELIILFGVPAELLILRVPWKVAIVVGIILRIIIMPWTGHPTDTLTSLRTAYLYYHQGWAPIFYNPPTVFAQAPSIWSMQFYYLLGLDGIDISVFLHSVGIMATFFAKLPFLIFDVASAILLSRLTSIRNYALFYFLNPFSIYVSAVWGQYEGLTALALISGYVAILNFKGRVATLTSFAGFVAGGLVELFGFLFIPFLALYLVIKRQYIAFVLSLLGMLLVLFTPSSVGRFVSSLGISNPILQPNLYSLTGSFGINSQLPFIGAVAASSTVASYFLVRSSLFSSTIVPISAAIISFELFAGNHPQIMLVPIGLMTVFFAKENDTQGLLFIWIAGAVLSFITIAGTQSFGYLLTGVGFYMIPLIEGGHHLQFYGTGLLSVCGTLLARAYSRLPLWLTSTVLVGLVGLGWFLVNFA